MPCKRITLGPVIPRKAPLVTKCRVDSVKLSIEKARPAARGAVLASDAFFPFRDSIDEAARAGITAIVQPGGSVRDTEVIEAADEHGISMIFTGLRHFKH